jgi:hypothetical protein
MVLACLNRMVLGTDKTADCGILYTTHQNGGGMPGLLQCVGMRTLLAACWSSTSPLGVQGVCARKAGMLQGRVLSCVHCANVCERLLQPQEARVICSWLCMG